MSINTNETYINSVLKDMPFIWAIKKTAEDFSADVYLAGGCVRDLIMGREAGDIDVVPFGADYEKFARALARKVKAFAVPFKDNVRLVSGNAVCDVSKPKGDCINEDLKKRDFTINNLACNLKGQIIGNADDIKNGVIRAVYREAFDDDPLRILRGFRFVASLGFYIEEDTLRLATIKSDKLSGVAAERITEELTKTFAGVHSGKALMLLEKSGVLKNIFQGEELDFASLLRFKGESFPLSAALLAGKSAINRLALSSKDEKTALYMLKHFNEASDIGRKSLREKRALLWKHFERIEDLLRFAAAKMPDKEEAINEWAALLPSINAKKAEAINGERIKKMGYSPGPLFGKIIADTAEKLALDEIDEDEIENYIEKKYGGIK